MKILSSRCLRVSLLLVFSGLSARADRFELIDGSVVLGHLVSADEGKFKVETAFAGVIDIAQDQVKKFATDEAVHVGLVAGGEMLGRVEAAGAGVEVVAATGPVRVATDQVVAVWRAGEDSPEVRRQKAEAAKLERRWSFEAAVAVTGRTGASEKFGGVIGLKATRENAQDKLILGLEAARAKDNGVDTANRQAAVADYSVFYSESNVWYVRTGLETDEINALDFRTTSAVGLGHKLIKREKQDLEARLGASYLYESFADDTRFESPGLDVALLHTFEFGTAKMQNALTYTPAFKNFSNFRLQHVSTIEVPLGASLWKLKLGVSNDYLSKPPASNERLDTTYFTSLLLTWK